MKRLEFVKKCAYFCFLSIALSFIVALGDTKNSNKTGFFKDRDTMLDHIEKWDNVFDAAADRQAEKKYMERDAEVHLWKKDSRLSNPVNAALLYYQAFLLRPKPDMATSLKIDEVLKGAEPDRKIRIYLGHCLPMIRVAEVASQMPKCTWGICYESETGFGVNALGVETRHLSFILAVDARTLAADGQYREALARCLTIRRLARHIGDETLFSYLVSRQTDSMALSTVQHVLGVMTPDADTLSWLRGQLAVVQGAPLSIGKALQADFESVIYNIRRNPSHLGKLRTMIVETDENEQTTKAPRSLTDEELLVRVHEPSQNFLNSVFQIMDSDMTYKWKHERIEELIGKLEEEYGNEPATGYVITLYAGRLLEWYELQVEHHAYLNGIKAAAEVYFVMAKTGQLPQKLPDHLPKDPFTHKEFGYEITDEGFVLRCECERFLSRKNKFLEFTVVR